MGQSTSVSGLPDARAFLDRAVAAEKGSSATFETKAAATTFRFRCYTCRDRERKKNVKIYPEDSPMYGASIYDTLMLVIRPVGEKWEFIAVHDEDWALENVSAEIKDL